MSDYPQTPWGNLQRLKDKQALGLDPAAPEVEEAPAEPTTERVTKKKAKKKKTG